ncbi:hypothetical protein KC953_02795, partial [Candidatus Saccharibacteria bacterium]|nr:hypothetical protein [Candidatus Saccharibacteria bacterium]
PNEVFSVLYDAAYEEDELRRRGLRSERIGQLVGKRLAKDLIDLQLRGIDTQNAFVPEERIAAGSSDAYGLTDEQWEKVDRLVDSGVLTYDEAIYRIKD